MILSVSFIHFMFVMVKGCVLFEVRTECLKRSIGFKSLKQNNLYEYKLCANEDQYKLTVHVMLASWSNARKANSGRSSQNCHFLSPQGPTFVDTGRGAPEVSELPSARGYNWATRLQEDINSGHWPSRFGVGFKARDLTLENTSCYEMSNKIDFVRFQVLTAASMVFRIVFWDILHCKMIVDRRFRGAYCLHRQGWLTFLRKPKSTKGSSCNGKSHVFLTTLSQ
jgi:hypothetical protein